MKRTKSLLIGAALVAAFSVSVGAFQGTDSAPNWIHYQGRLTKPSGAVVADGTQSVNFKLMNEANGVVWEETKDITVKQGIFSTRLGYPGGLPTAAFNGQLRLRVTVGSTVLPDQDLGSVGYAIMSHSVVDGAITNAKLANGSVDHAKLAPNSVITPAIADNAVTGSKLASDPSSMGRVSGGAMGVTNGNLGINGDKFLALAPGDTFSHGGKSFGHYALGWIGDPWYGGGATAWLSGYGGVKFFAGGYPRMSISPFGVIRMDASQYIDAYGFGGNPNISLAIGDNDTGFNWVGDGGIDFRSNNVTIATLRPDGFRVVSGTKNAVVETIDYGKRLLYCTEAADVRFTDEGNAQLKNGSARIEVDPVFLQTIEGEFVVTLTPYGPSSLYVSERGEDFVTVKSMSGSKNVEFSWRLSAKRKGYADRRLEEDRN